MRKLYSFLFVLICLGLNNVYGQLTVSGSLTPQQLVQNVLLGPGVTASNITYNGAPIAIGFFNGVNSNIGLDSGLIMTCGNINNALGPNTQTGASTDNSLNGDPDLDALMAPTLSYDASILEFDFIPTGDSLKFKYVFASEEYTEYVSQTPGGINDGFGFFLSGVSTPMPVTNIAVIPNTSTPITMFNVNCLNGSPYYVCNDPTNATSFNQCAASYNCPTTSAGTTVQYDGFTTVLIAKAHVICGETYHIKIAIGDGGDHILDSGVFLEAGSFASSSVSITSNISYGGPNDSTLFEGCGQACLIFDRGQGNINNTDTVLLNVTGSAVNGVDYTQIPSQIIFQPGQDSIVLCITATADAVTEGVEDLVLNAIPVGNSICIQGNSANVHILIGDYVPLAVNVTGNSPVCPGGNAILYTNVTGGAGPYAYNWSNSSQDSSIYVVPAQTTTYSVTVTDACNASGTTASMTVVVSPQLQLDVPDQTICEGEVVNITPAITGGAPAFYYIYSTVSGADTLTVNNDGSATLTPTGTGTYQLVVADNCNNSVSDAFTITLQEACEVFVPNVFTPNGDQANEYFVVKNLEYFPNSSLLVYNRWGNKVYESSNYQNNWNGDGASQGVYYYILNVSDGTLFKGFVTVIR